MIPKIIHLCWLSGDKFPSDIQTCIDTWHEKLPDYEIILWDRKRFDINSTPWVKEACEAKKYAFAADYIRLYALYNYGGIYLDSDVIVYKSFNNLLHLPYFIGEDQCSNFEPAIIGTEKKNPWIKCVLVDMRIDISVRQMEILIFSLYQLFLLKLCPTILLRKLHA